METFLAFLAGWIATLSGVALGGWFVYRTKRESYDPLIGPQPKGEVFNLGEDDFKFPDIKSSARLPKATEENHSRFVDQFADDLVKGAKGNDPNS